MNSDSPLTHQGADSPAAKNDLASVPVREKASPRTS